MHEGSDVVLKHAQSRAVGGQAQMTPACCERVACERQATQRRLLIAGAVRYPQVPWRILHSAVLGARVRLCAAANLRPCQSRGKQQLPATCSRLHHVLGLLKMVLPSRPPRASASWPSHSCVLWVEWHRSRTRQHSQQRSGGRRWMHGCTRHARSACSTWSISSPSSTPPSRPSSRAS